VYNCTTLGVRASSEVIDGFLGSKDIFMKTLNEALKCKIITTDEPLFTREQFDVIPG
jgi:hypothetical protein